MKRVPGRLAPELLCDHLDTEPADILRRTTSRLPASEGWLATGGIQMVASFRPFSDSGCAHYSLATDGEGEHSPRQSSLLRLAGTQARLLVSCDDPLRARSMSSDVSKRDEPHAESAVERETQLAGESTDAETGIR